MCVQEIDKKYKDIIIEILDSNLSEQEKADKIIELITLDSWENLYSLMNLNVYEYDQKLRRIGINYKYFKANGVFKKYKDFYKCTMDEAYARLDLLFIIENIMNSDLSDDEKMSELLKYYPKYEDFIKKYSLFIKFGSNDERLDKYREQLNNFSELDNRIKKLYDNKLLFNNALYRNEVEKILEVNLYLENYLFAEWVIKNYVEYDRNYLKQEFFSKIGITEEEYNYCVKLIEFLNPVLYKELVESLSDSNDRRMFNLDKTFLNLEFGIRNGVLHDGTTFDILEFYKRIPFKNSGANFRNKVFDFMQRIYGRTSSTFKTIGAYIYQNNIGAMKYVSREYNIKNKMIINGIEITEDIVNDIFDYMDINNLPKIYEVYRIVLNKYLNNEINMEEVRTKKEHFEVLEKKYDNPYTLVKKK